MSPGSSSPCTFDLGWPCTANPPNEGTLTDCAALVSQIETMVQDSLEIDLAPVEADLGNLIASIGAGLHTTLVQIESFVSDLLMQVHDLHAGTTTIPTPNVFLCLPAWSQSLLTSLGLCPCAPSTQPVLGSAPEAGTQPPRSFVPELEGDVAPDETEPIGIRPDRSAFCRAVLVCLADALRECAARLLRGISPQGGVAAAGGSVSANLESGTNGLAATGAGMGEPAQGATGAAPVLYSLSQLEAWEPLPEPTDEAEPPPPAPLAPEAEEPYEPAPAPLPPIVQPPWA